MKVDDSGMPDEQYWNSLFDIKRIVDWLELATLASSIAEIACGYGTFTIPIAKKVDVAVYAYDIEPGMVTICKDHADTERISNIRFEVRDAIGQGTGLKDESVGLVLLFNILHFPEKGILLKEASRILERNGVCAIIHWRKDIPTPRGPSLETRPDKESILEASRGTGLGYLSHTVLEPYHWGMKLIKGVAR
jgi:ubiquinone/menaquinone biosynthesis C-methylase UbiE